LRKSGCRWQVDSGSLIHCDCDGSLGATMGRRGTSEHPCWELGGGRLL